MRRFGFLSLRAIRGQIAALVIVSIVALHSILTTFFLLRGPDQPPPGESGARLAAMIEMLAATPEAERPRIVADIARSFPRFAIDLTAMPQPATAELTRPKAPCPRLMLGVSYHAFPLPADDGGCRIGIVLPDGAAISASLPPERHGGPFWGGPWMATLLFAVISVGLLSVWAARALTAPLSSFARAAEDFSLDGNAAPLPERGPDEIRALAKALNRMRERITGLIDDRTKMLAAISHDLRTPITRLRLRSEFIEDDANRGRMLSDINQMQTMLESVLSFLRNDCRLEALTLADVASSLQLVADQFADLGHKVTYCGPDHALAMVRPDDLGRAITNLVENAVRYGVEVSITLGMSEDMMIIEVADDGPGISDARKAAMLEPFIRGDDARNMDDAKGFGLGLSIARAIALGHQGTLSLLDRKPQGLIVRIEIPTRGRSNCQKPSEGYYSSLPA